MAATAFPRRKGLLVAGVASILLASASGAIALGARLKPTSATAVTDDLEELRAQLRDVKRMASRPAIVREVRTERQPALAVSAIANPATEVPPAELTPDEREHRSKVYHEAHVARCAETFALEQPDPEWAGVATRTLQASYSTEGGGAPSVSANCKATLCQVTFRYPSTEASLPSTPIPRARAWPGKAFAYFNSQTREGVSYIAREGFELPSVDPASLSY